MDCHPNHCIKLPTLTTTQRSNVEKQQTTEMNDFQELNTQQDLVMQHLDALEKKIKRMLDEYMGDDPITNQEQEQEQEEGENEVEDLAAFSTPEEEDYDEYREQDF